ncbi:MAG: hypothetical protein WAP98_08825 [Caldicoprobacterales bacterium]|jgi:hypothetical protein|nr:hypothetical protein [Clostridia bacterium]MDI9513392.1 hypothetical protein [Bacillota bacterium]NLH59302.1 hypothetical protein [Clostridiales bacterium]
MKTKRLRKMMTEFSQELGIEPRQMNKLGNKMLWAAASVVGFSLIKTMFKRR